MTALARRSTPDHQEARGRQVAPCSRCDGDCGGGVFAFVWGKRSVCLRSASDRRWLLDRLGRGVSRAGSLVLRTLASYELKGPFSWVSNETLAEDCSYASKQSVLTARMHLRARGLLSWRHRYVECKNGPQQTTNLHAINWPGLLQLYVLRGEAPEQSHWEPFSPAVLASLPPEATRGLRLVVPDNEPAAPPPPPVEPPPVEPPPVEPSPVEPVVASTPPAPPAEPALPRVLVLDDDFVPSHSFVFGRWKKAYEKRYRARYARNGRLDDKAMRELLPVVGELVDEQLAVPGERASRRLLHEQMLDHLFVGFLADPGHKDTLRERRHPFYMLTADLSKLGTPWKPGRPAPGPSSPVPDLLAAPPALPTTDPHPASAPLAARLLAGLAQGTISPADDPGLPPADGSSTPDPGHPEAPDGGALAAATPAAVHPEAPYALLDERVERGLARWRAVLGHALPADEGREQARRQLLRERLRGGLSDEELERVWAGAQGETWLSYARMMRVGEPYELLELLRPGRWQRFLSRPPPPE